MRRLNATPAYGRTWTTTSALCTITWNTSVTPKDSQLCHMARLCVVQFFTLPGILHLCHSLTLWHISFLITCYDGTRRFFFGVWRIFCTCDTRHQSPYIGLSQFFYRYHTQGRTEMQPRRTGTTFDALSESAERGSIMYLAIATPLEASPPVQE
jgi:hypothetical protein